MRRRIASAVGGMGEDWTTLLMLWGAGNTDDIGDPEVWKKASAHWTPHRERLITDKYERAMRGEADPEADDPDPIASFRSQFCNVWPAPNAFVAPGDPMVTETEWGGLNGFVPQDTPLLVAVESWFADGATAGAAYPQGRTRGCECHHVPRRAGSGGLDRDVRRSSSARRQVHSEPDPRIQAGRRHHPPGGCRSPSDG